MDWDEDAFELVWDQTKRLVCQPAPDGHGFFMSTLLDKCQLDYENYECLTLNEDSDDSDGYHNNTYSVIPPTYWRNRCTFVNYRHADECSYNQYRCTEGNRVVNYGCLMCQNVTSLPCVSDLTFRCGLFFRQISTQDVRAHILSCAICCDGGIDSYPHSISRENIKVLQKHARLVKESKFNREDLQNKKNAYDSLITKTCVHIKLHRHHLKHLFLNRNVYYDDSHKWSSINYLIETKNPIGYLVYLHVESEKCVKNLELLTSYRLSQLELLTFGRIDFLDATKATLSEKSITIPNVTINHDRHGLDVHYGAFSRASFTIIDVRIRDKTLSFTLQKGLFANYHRVTLLHLERQSAMIVFSLLKRRHATVVIDIICAYMIYDAIDHTIALCKMLFQMHANALKTLLRTYFNDLVFPFIESEMKRFITTYDVVGSISYPTFTRSLLQSSSLKRRLE